MRGDFLLVLLATGLATGVAQTDKTGVGQTDKKPATKHAASAAKTQKKEVISKHKEAAQVKTKAAPEETAEAQTKNAAEQTEAAQPEKKKKRGLFGFGKKSE